MAWGACFQFSTALLHQYFFQGRQDKSQLINQENFKRAMMQQSAKSSQQAKRPCRIRSRRAGSIPRSSSLLFDDYSLECVVVIEHYYCLSCCNALTLISALCCQHRISSRHRLSSRHRSSLQRSLQRSQKRFWQNNQRYVSHIMHIKEKKGLQ